MSTTIIPPPSLTSSSTSVEINFGLKQDEMTTLVASDRKHVKDATLPSQQVIRLRNKEVRFLYHILNKEPVLTLNEVELAIKIMDRFLLSSTGIELIENEDNVPGLFRLISIVSMNLANKHQSYDHFVDTEITGILNEPNYKQDNSYHFTNDNFVQMERLILNTIEWKIFVPTPLRYFDLIISMIQDLNGSLYYSNNTINYNAVQNHAIQIIEDVNSYDFVLSVGTISHVMSIIALSIAWEEITGEDMTAPFNRLLCQLVFTEDDFSNVDKEILYKLDSVRKDTVECLSKVRRQKRRSLLLSKKDDDTHIIVTPNRKRARRHDDNNNNDADNNGTLNTPVKRQCLVHPNDTDVESPSLPKLKMVDGNLVVVVEEDDDDDKKTTSVIVTFEVPNFEVPANIEINSSSSVEANEEEDNDNEEGQQEPEFGDPVGLGVFLSRRAVMAKRPRSSSGSSTDSGSKVGKKHKLSIETSDAALNIPTLDIPPNDGTSSSFVLVTPRPPWMLKHHNYPYEAIYPLNLIAPDDDDDDDILEKRR